MHCDHADSQELFANARFHIQDEALRGPVVLASDAAHFHENFEQETPVAILEKIFLMLEGIFARLDHVPVWPQLIFVCRRGQSRQYRYRIIDIRL
jgi:hypothetical protein